jgi:hypothetical protein
MELTPFMRCYARDGESVPEDLVRQIAAPITAQVASHGSHSGMHRMQAHRMRITQKSRETANVTAVSLGQAQGGYLPFFLAAFFAFFATVLASFSWKMDGRSVPSHLRSIPHIDSPSSIDTIS